MTERLCTISQSRSSRYLLSFVGVFLLSADLEARAHLQSLFAWSLCWRPGVSEMMFELYSVPGVTYAVDSLMSYAHNYATTPLEARDGLVLSFNTASTAVVPVLGGIPVYSRSKR